MFIIEWSEEITFSCVMYELWTYVFFFSWFRSK
jgi:hypothetical protein